jgi:hypothetical protein
LFQTSLPTTEDSLQSYAAVGPQLVPLNASGISPLSLSLSAISQFRKEKKRKRKWGEKKNDEQVSYFLSFTTRYHKRKRVAENMMPTPTMMLMMTRTKNVRKNCREMCRCCDRFCLSDQDDPVGCVVLSI